jgi:signal transduction histidine kinase/ActR/RegA family two-component response regulator
MSGGGVAKRDAVRGTVVVLAPGRDGELSCRVLAAQGRHCHRCRDAAEVQSVLGDEAGALLLSEEVLTRGFLGWLQEHARRQPAWSDLPVLVVAQQRGRHVDPAILGGWGNVTVLTRPMAVADLTSAVASALRARHRQFQVRDLLAQQEAEARRKDDFLAMLAHELRNPLSPVRYAAHALRALASAPRARHLVDVIERQVGHMGRIITQLLDISRLTRGSFVLDRAPLDLAELVRRCGEAREEGARARDVALEMRVDGPAWIDGDETRLHQVVDNLLDNALKFSPPGTRVLLQLQLAGELAQVEVCDEGDGIGPEDLPHVFQPFVQADRSLERARGGLGLGLAMVKGLVELHGGRVDVRSEVGRGSCFRVRLPLGAVPRPHEARAPLDETAPSGRRLRILIAEDNVDAAETMRTLLDLSGYETHVAHDGADAVRAAREHAPDVLLCDIGLPGMSGYEVGRTLRSDPALAHMVMMAITGYGTAEDARAAHAAGFHRHFAKPVDPSTVLDELRGMARAADGRS